MTDHKNRAAAANIVVGCLVVCVEARVLGCGGDWSMC